MKKLLSIIGLMTVTLASAQATRFVYQVSIKTDSTDAKSVKTELANLDVSPDKSIFYSDKNFKRDSLFSRMQQTGSFNFDRSQMEGLRSDIDFTVSKDYASQKETFKSRIGRDNYSYEESPAFNWQILPETVKIGEYKTQKAKTNYGGRIWNAWFTTDVPLQDGPYKFSGLPGLIVKIEDDKGDYSFDLMESKKIDAPAEFQTRGNVIKVAKKDYVKQNNVYRKDPVSSMTAGGGRGGNFMSRMTPEQRKEIEARLKKNVDDFNNPIELK